MNTPFEAGLGQFVKLDKGAGATGSPAPFIGRAALRQDYIRTARAKGLSEWVVVMRYALRNALLPIVTILGLQFGNLLGGAAVTETVFAWPGLGKLMVDAVYINDFPQIQASVMLFAITYVVVNLAIDILYSVIDPRIRRGG